MRSKESHELLRKVESYVEDQIVTYLEDLRKHEHCIRIPYNEWEKEDLYLPTTEECDVMLPDETTIPIIFFRKFLRYTNSNKENEVWQLVWDFRMSNSYILSKTGSI